MPVRRLPRGYHCHSLVKPFDALPASPLDSEDQLCLAGELYP